MKKEGILKPKKIRKKIICKTEEKKMSGMNDQIYRYV